ncbi:hypothetical protein F5050DRAFT_1667120 [Lentinula boryana]|uniref:PH domain-containing protein n=1 Tax=Lentinula boryana TaxID=40481 RepID=A0ABQ8QME6_9AGAR|nr:hypothetical protein F5050DRAFT_1667120 [Lentinula boryana]
MGPRPLESRDSRRSFSGLQRTGSAKQLIEIYEGRQQTIPSTPPLSFLNKPSSPRQKKDKSPIRQSLSKVIGLFKKGTSTRQIRHITPLQYTPSGSRLSGSLLYLSRNESASPIWIPCTAELECGNLRLTCSIPNANFNSFPIQLKYCSDVRSLSTCEIPEQELILLQANTAKESGDPRIFELVFGEEMTTEKFAAPSVTDRASWVSTIWDSILLMQESKSIYRFEDSEKLHSTRLELSMTMAPIVDLSKPLPPPIEERGLPALPPQSECDLGNAPVISYATLPVMARNFSNDTHLQNTTPYSIPRIIAHSLSVTPTSPQSLRSTSIANLSKRSVVKQRLAQIQNEHSQDSINYSPVSPRTWNRPLPSPRSPRKDKFPELQETSQAMQRTCTGDSIVDSYSYTNQLVASASTTPWSRPAVDIRHTLSSMNKDISYTGHAMSSIDQRLEVLQSRTDTKGSESSSEKLSVQAQDLADIQKSLDGLETLLTSNVVTTLKQLEVDSKHRHSPSEPTGHSTCATNFEIQTQFAEVLALLRDQNDKNAQRDQLQTDSVRYLNELNVWLETFVNGGTSQIQVLSTTLQQVLHSLGAITSQDGVTAVQGLAPGQLLNDQGDTAQLRTSLNNAIGHLNGQGGAVNSIFEVIERQRQDHEGLMRLLTNELSNEIKGERLRFVEAMKEATAINIQAQVEEFKKELKREVHGMTHEVGRLHQEKQSIENQIADLLAFHSKQANKGSIPPGLVPALEPALSNYSTPQRGRGVGGLRTPQASPERRRRTGY